MPFEMQAFRPSSITENALKNEEALLSQSGMRYIHIPVNYTPTEENFNQFETSMQETVDEKVWVHCAANARVSAFLYRYRCSVLGEDEPTARKEMQKIWEPFGVWKNSSTGAECNLNKAATVSFSTLRHIETA